MDPLTLSTIIGVGGNLLGGLLSGAGQSKENATSRAHQLQMLLAQLDSQRQQYETARGDEQAKTALDAATTNPTRVNWRQNQAIQNAIMPQLRNVSVNAPMGMGAYVPQVSGGLRLPEGGFSPDTLKFFNDNAMLQGEMDLDRAAGAASGGRSTPASYGAIYGTPQASEGESRVAQANAGLRRIDEEAALRRQMAMMNSLQPRPTRKA